MAAGARGCSAAREKGRCRPACVAGEEGERGRRREEKKRIKENGKMGKRKIKRKGGEREEKERRVGANRGEWSRVARRSVVRDAWHRKKRGPRQGLDIGMFGTGKIPEIIGLGL